MLRSSTCLAIGSDHTYPPVLSRAQRWVSNSADLGEKVADPALTSVRSALISFFPFQPPEPIPSSVQNPRLHHPQALCMYLRRVSWLFPSQAHWLFESQAHQLRCCQAHCLWLSQVHWPPNSNITKGGGGGGGGGLFTSLIPAPELTPVLAQAPELSCSSRAPSSARSSRVQPRIPYFPQENLEGVHIPMAKPAKATEDPPPESPDPPWTRESPAQPWQPELPALPWLLELPGPPLGPALCPRWYC
ncbi:uncharacterized protein LOC113052492 [Carassius auratus]|uniref:Uncharacterized protein LOC113052492 n=1 Tax=Carassius auratus TaxID=7957 RepID=A0A6P6KK95_CARAU|nr:uncharacterized protein LOC113052492 [Carassius auratus]